MTTFDKFKLYIEYKKKITPLCLKITSFFFLLFELKYANYLPVMNCGHATSVNSQRITYQISQLSSLL